MKIVYVLTSSESDLYYEQFFLSIVSLRLFNPDSEVIVLVDEKTKQGLTGKRAGYEKFASEIKVIAVPNEFSQIEISRWIKTSIRSYVSGDFLFIDCDTIITDNILQGLPENIKIGAILDTHVQISDHHLKNVFIRQRSASKFIEKNQLTNYFNSGILFCADIPETFDFFYYWNKLWTKSYTHGIYADQPSFNQVNLELCSIVHELPGEWNCQISHNGLPYLSNAKIIHYYATSLVSTQPAYKLASPEVFISIKETGNLPPQILRLLENPKAAFEPFSRIISDKTVIDALDNSNYFKYIRFNKRYPGIPKKISFFTGLLMQKIKKCSLLNLLSGNNQL